MCGRLLLCKNGAPLFTWAFPKRRLINMIHPTHDTTNDRADEQMNELFQRIDGMVVIYLRWLVGVLR